MSESAHRLPALPDLHPPSQSRMVEIRPSLSLGSSLPRRRPVACLPRSLIERLIVDAAAECYDVVSVLGGELPLGVGLADALTIAKTLGLATTLTTDLLALTRRRLDRLAGVLDAMAVTLYGAPQSHDHIRGKTGAFRTMAARLPALRAAGIPFGFMFSLTDTNLGQLPWVTRFALEEGARLLQISPAEAERGCGETAVTVAYLAFLRLRERVGDRMSIRLDLTRHDPGRGGAAPADHPTARLADLVGTLVVEADGSVVPLRCGFPRRYALGNLRFARLPVLAARWRSHGGYARFRGYSAQTSHAAAPPAAFNWFDAVSSRSALVSAE